MGNWLQKALGRPESSAERPVPVPFEMTCLCGHALTGTRQERARRMICSECGRAQFILPVNRYPLSDWKYFGGEQTQEPIDPTDELPTFTGAVAAPDSSPAIRKPRVTPRQKPRPSNNDADQIRVVDDEDEPQPPRTSSRRRSARWDAIEMAPRDRPNSRGKVLAVLGVLSLLVVLFVVGMLFKHRRDAAELRYKQASDSGYAAFDTGDFGKARAEFHLALQAAAILGLTPSQREAVQTRHAHADAIVKLVDLDLFDLLSLPTSDVVGKSVIVQTSVATQEVQQEQTTIIEWQLLGATRAVRLRGLDDLAAQATRSGLTEVLFAAEIERIESLDGGAVSIVYFRPGSAFLWQDFESLKRLGLCVETDEESTHSYRQLIARQTAAVRGEAMPTLTVTPSAEPKAGTP